MKEEIAALKVDNSVLLETQVRLETALVAFTAEGATGEDMPVVLAQLMKQLSAEIIEQRCTNENLQEQFSDMLCCCEESEAQRDALQHQVS
jgi:hypothetical protein